MAAFAWKRGSYAFLIKMAADKEAYVLHFV